MAIEELGRAKEDWFTQQLKLTHDIPSHDTFGDVFAAIDTEQFSECFTRWVADLAQLTEGEIIAIDGKCLRRSIDKTSKKAAIHMVSAWAQRNSLVLGQVRVDDKSNEITAIPKLLSRLDIAGAIVTIDAMGCQKKIAQQIIQQEGDYVLSLKGNQGNLHDDVTTYSPPPYRPLLHCKRSTEGMDALKHAQYVSPMTSRGLKSVTPGQGYRALLRSPPKGS